MSAVKKIFQLGFPWQTLDPFLFCVYHKDDYPVSNGNFGPKASLAGRNIGQDFNMKDGWNMYHGETVPGFPAHPHRGFETITVVNQGVVDHADSLGAAGRYRGGDTQWMTAGRGVQHSEMFPLLSDEEPNPLELFQIWINLPAKSKMCEPHFAMLWKEQTPVVTVTDDQGLSTTVRVVAGEFQGEKAAPPPPESWAADAENEVAVWTLSLAANARFTLPPAAGNVNRRLYYYRGEGLHIEGQAIPLQHGVDVDAQQSVSLVAGAQACELLMLQGKPIAEPVAQYGPFVMNSEAEIRQAFADYRRDQFGGWPWGEADYHHGAKPYRFAKHADGTVEEFN